MAKRRRGLSPGTRAAYEEDLRRAREAGVDAPPVDPVGSAPGAPMFRLAGSLSVVGDVEEGIEALRSQEHQAAADRFTDL